MDSQIQKPRDVIGGCVIIAIGAFFLLTGRELELGTSLSMGAGYFPTALSIITIILGGFLALKGLRGARVEGAFSGVPWIPLASIIGSVVFFGITIRGIGIAPAVAIVVFVTALVSRYARWTTAILLAIGMAAFCTAIFIYLLNLPLPTFGPWLSLGHWAPAPAPAQ